MSYPPVYTAHVAALKLVLLFHAPGPWTHERQAEWLNLIRMIEEAAGRILFRGTPEATTRVLCDAIRAVLDQEEL